MALLGRIFVIIFAFILASIAGAMVLAIGVMMPAWDDVLMPTLEQSSFAIVVAISAFFISAVALLPAAIVIAVAEAFRVRSVLLYGAAGGIGLLAVYYATGWGERGMYVNVPLTHQAELMAAAGIVAGLVYWAVAGRHAGKWRDPARSATGA
jgi:hypothetical protein